MGKELAITLYLMVVRVQFSLCKRFPVKNKKVTFIVSFAQNSLWVYKEMQRQSLAKDVVFLYTKGSAFDLKDVTGVKLIPFKEGKPLAMMRSLFHLATSNIVIIDNYFAFLSAIRFKKGVQCIQLWHAAGAIKTFGLKDRSIEHRTQKARDRFIKVYQRFDKIVVGSDIMIAIFMEAFGLPKSHFLTTGIPRTDLFYDNMKQQAIKDHIYKNHPAIKNKTVLLYAPTYRDGELDHFDLQIDLNVLSQSLSDTHVLFIKLHPAIKEKANYEALYPGFVYDYTSYKDVNELLCVTDILITDYSSIAYEFALLTRPMIFYPYDLETYQVERGLWDDYANLVTGPIVFQTEEIVNRIKQADFNLIDIQRFSDDWNRYSDGHSSEKLVRYLREQMNL